MGEVGGAENEAFSDVDFNLNLHLISALDGCTEYYLGMERMYVCTSPVITSIPYHTIPHIPETPYIRRCIHGQVLTTLVKMGKR